MKINLDIKKRYLIFGFFVFGAICCFLIIKAYNPNFNNPSTTARTFGHSADEVVVKMSNGDLRTVQELLRNGIGQGSLPICENGEYLIYQDGWRCTGEEPPVLNPFYKFFLLSYENYNGNLYGTAKSRGFNSLDYGLDPSIDYFGLYFADYLCWLEVNKYPFKGKPEGKVFDKKEVRAFLVKMNIGEGVVVNNLLPETTYMIGKLGSTYYGGNTFTTNTNGVGPGNFQRWSDLRNFGIIADYLTGRKDFVNNPAYWPNYESYPPTFEDCNDWRSDNSGLFATFGSSFNGNASRWDINAGSSEVTGRCNMGYKLICIVEANP